MIITGTGVAVAIAGGIATFALLELKDLKKALKKQNNK